MAEQFHGLRVAEVVRETDDANSIRFELPDALRDAFAFRAGQHVTLRAKIGGEEVRRNYSLCVAPDEGVLKVTVKRVAEGANYVIQNPFAVMIVQKAKATIEAARRGSKARS